MAIETRAICDACEPSGEATGVLITSGDDPATELEVEAVLAACGWTVDDQGLHVCPLNHNQPSDALFDATSLGYL